MMSHASPPADPENHAVRVLLVDDVPSVRRELRQLLELSEAVQVVGESGDGQDAIRQAAELSPDVILMDLEMPLLNGYEAARQIKAQIPAPRVVILSVHAGPVPEERARAAGADRFVVKGASYEALLAAILGNEDPINSIEEGENS